MKNYKKGFAVIVVIVILIIAGLFYFKNDIKSQEQPIAVDTSDWKTYKNEKYGFEFQVPKDFKEVERFVQEKTENMSFNQYDVQIYVQDMEGEDIDFWTKRYKKMALFLEENIINGIEVRDGIFYRTDGGTGDRQTIFYKPGEKYMVILTQDVDLLEDGVEKYKNSKRAEDFESVAKTFKFTK